MQRWFFLPILNWAENFLALRLGSAILFPPRSDIFNSHTVYQLENNVSRGGIGGKCIWKKTRPHLVSWVLGGECHFMSCYGWKKIAGRIKQAWGYAELWLKL